MSPRPPGCRKHGLELWHVQNSGKGKCKKCASEYYAARYRARSEMYRERSRASWHARGRAAARARSRGEARAAEWVRENAASPFVPDQSVAKVLDLHALAHGHVGDLLAWEREALRAQLAGLRAQEARP